MVNIVRLCELLPDRCPGCGTATANGFCGGCRSDLARVLAPCRRCGLCQPVRLCPLAEAPWPIAATVAPFEYVGPMRRHIQALKFGNRRGIGRALGELLAEHLSMQGGVPAVDAAVAVPLHRRRFLERGYNQSSEILKALSRELRLAMISVGVARRRATDAQAQLSARSRRENLRGAFAVDAHVADLRLAIVDDVITTGATVNACADALLAAGARSVVAWAVARSI